MAVLNFYHLGKQIPENGVYIGRHNAKLGLVGSQFANPFPISDAQPRAVVIDKYQRWLWEEIKAKRISLPDLLALDGKDLVCFCAPQACHGHVLEKAVAWAKTQPLQDTSQTPVSTSAPARPRF